MLAELCLFAICLHNGEGPGTSFDREAFGHYKLASIPDGGYACFRLSFKLNLAWINPCEEHSELYRRERCRQSKKQGQRDNTEPSNVGEKLELDTGETQGGYRAADCSIEHFCDGSIASVKITLYHIPSLGTLLNVLSICLNETNLAKYICGQSVRHHDYNFTVVGALLYGVRDRYSAQLLALHNTFTMHQAVLSVGKKKDGKRKFKYVTRVHPHCNTRYLRENLRELQRDGARLFERFTEGNLSHDHLERKEERGLLSKGNVRT